MKINDALQKAKELLKQNEVDDREARLLLAFSLGVTKEELLIMTDITEEQFSDYIQCVNKRCSKVPYAYIVGHKEFMKLNFNVNENVLIPREETETLVLEVLKYVDNTFDKNDNISILDMCTGSGCIAISLKKILSDEGYKNVSITAVDKSEEALTVAKENASLNEVTVDFICSDVFSKLNGSFDIIVSNPPYAETDMIEMLEEEVKDNEPRMALDGGKDGLNFYRKITNEATNYFNKDGFLAFEIGYYQAVGVIQIFKENGYKDIEVIKDLDGNDRVVKGKYLS